MSIIIQSLIKKFGKQVLFDGIDLHIENVRMTALIGGSGCGKTTLLRMICGLDKDYSGEIIGVPDHISFLFQEDRLLPWCNVKENIEFVLKDVMTKEQMDKAVSQIIKDVQLDGHENKLPAELSGGMQRRVAMARAFCYPSSLLLMDEPFKGFDLKLNLELIELLKKLHANSHKTVILVAHETELIKRLPDCSVIDVEAFSLAKRR
jgi:NitT/TauT family transport system ATP-binding protein